MGLFDFFKVPAIDQGAAGEEEQAERPAAFGKFQIASHVSVDSFISRDMKRLYDKGYADGEKVKSFMD